MRQRFNFCVAKKGERLDLSVLQYLESSFLTESLDNISASRSQISHWIECGHVLVDGVSVRKSGARLKLGQHIELNIPTPEPIALEADESVAFTIIYEDEDLVVLDKPAGVIVHPGAGARHGTLVHGLLAKIGDSLKGVGDELRPGIVHRLDKNTSGLMVVAKSAMAHRILADQFIPPRKISRVYLALVRSLPREARSESGIISLPIARHPVDRKRMAVAKSGGREAVTHWKIRESYACGYLLELVLETGRTHQIRVHLQAVGSPIIGDPEYGEALGGLPKVVAKAMCGFSRQALHASKLTFVHPRSACKLSFEAPLPQDMLALIQTFGAYGKHCC